MPAARTRSRIVSGDSARQSSPAAGHSGSGRPASRPSLSRTMHGALRPDGCGIGRDSIAAMVPDVVACTGSETYPSARAMVWPR